MFDFSKKNINFLILSKRQNKVKKNYFIDIVSLIFFSSRNIIELTYISHLPVNLLYYIYIIVYLNIHIFRNAERKYLSFILKNFSFSQVFNANTSY